MFKLTIAIALAGCINMPNVPPHARSMPDMLRAAARIQVDCTLGDPFEGNNVDVPIAHTGWNDFHISAGFATAVVTDERHMLTAYHAVKCPTFPTVYAFLSDGRRINMAVDREDPEHDLARLTMTSADRFHLDIAPPIIGKRPTRGDPVCSMVTVPTWHWSCGDVEATFTPPVDNRKDGGSTYDIDANLDTQHGNSGGGTYASDGSLIGLVTGVCKTGSCAGVMSLEGKEITK